MPTNLRPRGEIVTDNEWTPLLRLRYRLAMWRRDITRALGRARYRRCKRSRWHTR